MDFITFPIVIPSADIEFILTAEGMTIGNVIKSIQMLTQSVSEISNTMERLEELFKNQQESTRDQMNEFQRHNSSLIKYMAVIFAIILTTIGIIITCVLPVLL
jgi:type IV secretory pathway component VirB8